MTDNTLHLLYCLQTGQKIAAVVKQLYLHMLEEQKQQKKNQTLHGTSSVQEQAQQQGMPSQQQPDQHQHGAVGIDEAKEEHSCIVEAAADGASVPLVVSERASNPTGPDGAGPQPASAGTDQHLWEQLMERWASVYSKCF